MSKEDRYIYMISTAQHLLKNRIIERFKQEGLGITPSNSTILFLLEKNGPMQMNELSDAMYIENSTVTGLVDRMEKKGFVRRTPVEGDRRKWNIEITGEGIEEMHRAGAIISSINSQITEGFSTRELESFTKILGSFFTRFAGKKEREP